MIEASSCVACYHRAQSEVGIYVLRPTCLQLWGIRTTLCVHAAEAFALYSLTDVTRDKLGE